MGLDVGATSDLLWRVGSAERQPVVFVADERLAEELSTLPRPLVVVVGVLPQADRTLFVEGDTVVVEPTGLRLPALLPAEEELHRVERLRAAASELPDPNASLTQEENAPFEGDLPIPGPIEVRILRGTPDLVGTPADGEVRADVVQLVAYLVLHGRRATTARLRDIYGVYRADTSRADRTIWNATSSARQVLGGEVLPLARGSQPYTIAPEVSCDWLRFREIAAAGRSLETAGRYVDAAYAYTIALELVGDEAPCSDEAVAGRYVWLDAEQFLVEIEHAVVDTAYRLAMLSIREHPYEKSLDDAAWAIGVGRRVSSDARPLVEAALFLADAQSNVEALREAHRSAAAAVDELDLGVDVDPHVETIYQTLRRRAGDVAGPRG